MWPTRLLSFQSCFNFRDLGGYDTTDGRRVRWNTLYRADTLHRLTAADREAFALLSLRTVIDLRSMTELDDHGRLVTENDSWRWTHVPMLDNVKLAPRSPSDGPMELPAPARPAEGYLRIVDQFGPAIAAVVALLSDAEAFPAVFHCTAGKDRTGIVAAVLLDVLGVADETIAIDYALTEQTRDRSTAWIEIHEPEYAAYLAQIPAERRAATPEKMLDFLRGMKDTYGSVSEFLLRMGVTAAQLEMLRAALLEDQPDDLPTPPQPAGSSSP